MKAYCCYFGNGRFEAMARALGVSIRANAPECEPVIERVNPPAFLHTFTSNTEKLMHWRRQVDALPEGGRLVLLDGDTIVRRPLAQAFNEFDTPVAMTLKGPHVTRMRYNCGVVFVRGGAGAREFFARWSEVNERLFRNRDEHIPYESNHGGMNQAAWGAMRELNDPACAHVSDLPCETWNACYPPLWEHAQLRARIVHYKSDLRMAIWSHGSRYHDLVAEWRGYERLSHALG